MRKVLAFMLSFTNVYGQGYYFDLNGTSTSSYPAIEILSKNDPFPAHDYNEVLRHYRSDTRKREPQFLGFDIQDDNIEIDMEIAVPFLSVPTKKGLSKRRNFANINVAAIILAGIVGVVGTMLGGAARFFRGEKFFDGPLFRNGNKKKSKQKREAEHDEFVFEMFHKIERDLLKMDFDLIACAQRSICWHASNCMLSVAENRAGKLDKFVTGFINADWKHRVFTDSDWLNALETARTGQSCEAAFQKCALNSENLEQFTKKIRKYAKPKK